MSLVTALPEELGLDPDRWDFAARYAHNLVACGHVPALAYQIVRPDAVTEPVAYGCRRLADSTRLGPDLPTDTIFLTASLSKPIVAMAVLKLVEDGRLSIQDKVADLLPEFDSAPKRPTTVRHLLTHTSGLPDMLPNNRQLRQNQSGLDAFVRGACAVTLDFPPGRGVQYQSMGYALLGEIIARVTGQTCREFLQTALFEPLGMTDTTLGAPDEWFTGRDPIINRVAEVRVPEEQQGGDDWNWNSRYWRSLGAPWGGVLSTVGDLSRFLQVCLRLWNTDNNFNRLLARSTIESATANQLDSFHDLPEADRRTRGWGYGWRLNWTGHHATFGELLPPETYGHWGATGTLWWVDDIHGVGLVLLATQPLARGDNTLLRLSNVIASAVVE